MVAGLIVLVVFAATLVYLGFLLGKWCGRRALRQAHQDQLTGLPNRTIGLNILNRAQSDNRSVTVGIADINGLKSRNDSEGHLSGDELIVSVASQLQRLIGLLPAGSMVARIGGDEFLIVTRATAVELSLAFEHVHSRRCDVSLGVAEMVPGMTVKHILGCADRAMYTAKDAKTPVVTYTIALGSPSEPREGIVRRAHRN